MVKVGGVARVSGSGIEDYKNFFPIIIKPGSILCGPVVPDDEFIYVVGEDGNLKKYEFVEATGPLKMGEEYKRAGDHIPKNGRYHMCVLVDGELREYRDTGNELALENIFSESTESSWEAILFFQ